MCSDAGLNDQATDEKYIVNMTSSWVSDEGGVSKYVISLNLWSVVSFHPGCEGADLTEAWQSHMAICRRSVLPVLSEAAMLTTSLLRGAQALSYLSSTAVRSADVLIPLRSELAAIADSRFLLAVTTQADQHDVDLRAILASQNQRTIRSGSCSFVGTLGQ